MRGRSSSGPDVFNIPEMGLFWMKMHLTENGRFHVAENLELSLH